MVKRYGWPAIPPRQRRCTAAKAAACAIPRNLEGAGEAMDLSVQKDKRGYIAMMATCKPTRQWNAWVTAVREVGEGKKVGNRKRLLALEPEPPVFIDPTTHPETFKTLYVYCKIDVRAEEALDQSLPDLSPSEQEIWFLNQRINWRGLRVDVPLIKKITEITAIESKKKLKQLDKLTMGLITKPGATKSILEFLALDGIELPNLRANTVSDHLNGYDLTPDMRTLLELRKALSLTSTRKYQAFLDRVNDDDRVRDLLLYHGASTGRDTGTGVQPHNFPRGILKIDKAHPYDYVDNVSECDHGMLKVLYGDSLAVLFSSILRNMIIPSDGKELYVADFSKIEVAVLWWLAGNEDGLEILRSGRDPYKYQAAANTNQKYEDIHDDSEDRQLGKAQVLGCGFGMGSGKFQRTAWDQYRLKLTLKQSKKAVASYRKANSEVPELWENFELAAIAAVKKPGRKYKVRQCSFLVERGFLWMQLPSGRRLAYRSPQISWRVREYDEVTENEITGEITTKKKYTEPLQTIEYWAVNPKTKKWNQERTWGGTLVQGATQATARDLMMPAMVRLEKRGYQALLSVHDEGICEREIGQGSLEEFTKIMCELPPWALGLPVEAKGWKGPRYRK